MRLPASDLLDSLPAELSQQLKEHADQALLDFIRPNSASQFAQNAPVLAQFRGAIAQGDSKDDIELLDDFRSLVPITSYESYEPFIAKFFAAPCREVDVKDMFAPGLPSFLATSTGTSGKEPKILARYQPPPEYLQHPAYLMPPSSPDGTILSPSSLRYSKVLKIDREDGQGSQGLVVCAISSGFPRMHMKWNVEHDKDRLNLWVPGQTAPYAVGLVEGYRPFFILHALFALADSRVKTMCFLFANAFAALLQFIEDEWLLLVDCIEHGIIPDLENSDIQLRGALEKQFTAKPARAAELWEIGPPKGVEGWAVRVWPDLTTFIGITEGSSATSVPMIKRVLGPSIAIQSRGYGSTECTVALPYHNGDPAVDLKITMINGVPEFVDPYSDMPSDILSVWELVKGRHYQAVMTSRDGLWRYRLGDIVSVKGFAPDDGMPVINYMHRQEGSPLGACTELDLTNAIIATAEQRIGQITDFTVVRDERKVPLTFGFLVEIEGEIRNDASMAPQHIAEVLMESSYGYRITFWQGLIRKPSIHLVEKGTFADFRKWKCDKGVSMAQMKVPVVLNDETSKEWLLKKVLMEL